LLQIYRADRLKRRTVKSQQIRDDVLGPALSPHRFLQEIRGRFLIPFPCCETLEHLAFMIDSPPKVVAFAIDHRKKLAEVPAPLGTETLPFDPSRTDLGRADRAKAVPPETDVS